MCDPLTAVNPTAEFKVNSIAMPHNVMSVLAQLSTEEVTWAERGK
jgi:hypothetical protein